MSRVEAWTIYSLEGTCRLFSKVDEFSPTKFSPSVHTLVASVMKTLKNLPVVLSFVHKNDCILFKKTDFTFNNLLKQKEKVFSNLR